MNEEQLDAFMRVIEEDELWHGFFYTELTTGLRQGELCGLRWEDFDEADGTLMIRRTVHRKNGGKHTVGETKTERGTRKNVLPSITAELLHKRKGQVKSEWIFPDPLNPDEPTNPNAAYYRIKVLLKKVGLPSIRFHSLRHTFSTHALARVLLPEIRTFFESEEGQREFAEWKARRKATTTEQG